jgi:hypothetical protein
MLCPPLFVLFVEIHILPDIRNNRHQKKKLVIYNLF